MSSCICVHASLIGPKRACVMGCAKQISSHFCLSLLPKIGLEPSKWSSFASVKMSGTNLNNMALGESLHS